MRLSLVAVCLLLALSGRTSGTADMMDQLRAVDPCDLDPELCQGDEGLDPNPLASRALENETVVCFAPYCFGCDMSNIETSVFLDGGQYTVTCQEGFEMVGDPIITCSQEEGGWDHVPECRLLPTGPTEAPPETTTAKKGSHCHHHKHPQKQKCTAPVVDNAMIISSLEEFEEGQFLSIRCNEGFETEIGGAVDETRPLVRLTCQKDGEWAGIVPTCIVKSTTALPTPSPTIPDTEKSTTSMPPPTTTTTQTVTTTTPDTSVICQVPEIGNAEILITEDSYKKGDIIVFRCLEGFDGNAPLAYIRCEGDNTWSRDMNFCADLITTLEPTTQIATTTPISTPSPPTPEPTITCPEPSVENADILAFKRDLDDADFFKDYEMGTVIQIRCKEGHATVVNGDILVYSRPIYRVRCGEEGTWKGQQPVCQLFTCGSPVLSTGVQIKPIETDKTGRYENGQTVQFNCRMQYHELVGNKNSTCDMQTRGWNKRTPVCRDTRCPRLHWPKNGRLTGESSRLGAKIVANCHGNLQLSGSEERTCLKNGSWSGEVAACQSPEYLCPDPGVVDGGSRQGNNFRDGAALLHSCNHGFFMIGKAKQKCRTDGTWNNPAPKCLGPNQYSDPEEAADSLSKMIKAEEDRLMNGQANQVYFFLDASGSVSKEVMAAQKLLFARMTRRFENVPLSLVVYNNTAEMPYRHGDAIGMQIAIANAPSVGKGSTSFREAFRLAYKFSNSRYPRTFVILMNDVMDQHGRLTKVLLQRKKRQPQLYIVGIGGHVDRQELIQAVDNSRSLPHKDHLFFMKDNEDLKSLAEKI